MVKHVCRSVRIEGGFAAQPPIFFRAPHGQAFSSLILPITVFALPRCFGGGGVRNQRLEPLHALYGTGCLAPIKAALDAGELRMDAWFGSLQVERVEERRWRQQHPSGHSLLNVNRAEDFEVVVAAAAGLLAQDPG